MHVRELASWPIEKRKSFIDSLNTEEKCDFIDGLEYEMASFMPRDDKRYFDDIDVYIEHLQAIDGLVDPADTVRSHELAHARCAWKLGVSTVKFYTKILPSGREMGAFTAAFGPIDLPNIAFAAISVAPLLPSTYDIRGIRPLGYANAEYL